MKVINLKQISGWDRALDAARHTVGKQPLHKEPSNQWKKEMLLSEHSPIRLVEYEWIWVDIPQYVTVHIARHHVGCEKFICTQREDRTGVARKDRKQTDTNTFLMTANAQAIINISRKRMCTKADSKTMLAWIKMLNQLTEIDYQLSSVCVPECIYRGFCPEKKSCGAINTEKYQNWLNEYRNCK